MNLKNLASNFHFLLKKRFGISNILVCFLADLDEEYGDFEDYE